MLLCAWEREKCERRTLPIDRILGSSFSYNDPSCLIHDCKRFLFSLLICTYSTICPNTVPIIVCRTLSPQRHAWPQSFSIAAKMSGHDVCVCEGVWVWVSGIMQQRCEPTIALFYKQTSHPHPPSNISRALFLHFLILFPFDLLLRFFVSVSAYVSALFLLLRIKRIQHSSLTEWGLSYQHIRFLSECFSIFELRPLLFYFILVLLPIIRYCNKYIRRWPSNPITFEPILN